MKRCLYDPEVLCGNAISKKDCRGCETRRDVLWERKNSQQSTEKAVKK